MTETTATTLTAFPSPMVIVDCETTGGKATYHRIIEIGLLVIEDGKITQRWQQFVNPETHLPAMIQRLTGITPNQLKDAPVFTDIAAELMGYLEGCVFVAHNARFDYGFLKNEFQRLGMSYSAKTLCSVKLSRTLYPHYKRHSLNALIRRFQLNMENRHRALDDADAVWQFFGKISQQFDADDIAAACQNILHRPALPTQLAAKDIDDLPKTPGVYYFYDANDKLLYVGKSINIRERVMSHFTQDYRNPKDLEMTTQIAHIDHECTPSDLGAQLRESQQIKALNPLYNRRLKRVRQLYQYQIQEDALGYNTIRIVPVTDTHSDAVLSEQFGLFRSKRQAEARLNKLAEYFFLCQKLCGLQSSERAENRTSCFAFQLKRCLGACCQQETPAQYNERVHMALKEYRYQAWPWQNAILLEEHSKAGKDNDGSDDSGSVVHLINEWRYLGIIRTQDELYDRGFTLADDQQAVSALSEPQPQLDDAALPPDFDLDTYLILIRFLLNPEQMKAHRLTVRPLMPLY